LIQILTFWFFNLIDAYVHLKYGERKAELLKNHPDIIVEIGAGYGANFRYLKRGTRVKAIEPNTGFHEVLKRRAQKYGILVEVYAGKAEEIKLSNNSTQMVLSSLVLCSVTNLPKVLSEIKRILKPGGKFVYIEHVRAHKHTWVCKVQRVVKNSWKWLFDGCNVTRDTGRIIQVSGFSTVTQQAFSQRTILIPIIPHIAGIAVK
jgi:ubiquinone/menaquinone biosynthesis C-methylase UbiE